MFHKCASWPCCSAAPTLANRCWYALQKCSRSRAGFVRDLFVEHGQQPPSAFTPASVPQVLETAQATSDAAAARLAAHREAEVRAELEAAANAERRRRHEAIDKVRWLQLLLQTCCA